MIDERQVIDILGDDRHSSPGLDPDLVMAGARRRRTRNLAGTGLASVAVAGIAVAGVVVAGGLGPGPAPGEAGQPPVAGSSTGSSTGPSTGPTATPTAQPSRRVVGKDSSKQTPGGRVDWKRGGTVGARPIGTIPRSGRVEIADRYWFETKGAAWCITKVEPAAPSGTIQPFGCRGTIGNTNLAPGLSSMQSSGSYVSSVFDGDLRRVLYAAGDRYYEARLYRLAAAPGWMVAVAQLPAGQPATAVFGYDRDGELAGRFPSVADGGPRNDPLR